jgi:homoserine kinase type II
MSASPLDAAAREVLNRYTPPLPEAVAVFLGNRGGFSGARIWRLDGALGPLCLRAWPAHVSVSRLADLHRAMTRARSAGLHFVPAVLVAHTGQTHVECAGRLWEVTEWLPGRADFHGRPSPARLEAACAALALLHTAWQRTAPAPNLCPAVARRLDCVREWRALVRSGWRPSFAAEATDPLPRAAEHAWHLLSRWLERVPPMLQRWTDRAWPLQPCLCDVWHDHVLFEGERLTGLVDYGTLKTDEVAVDVARMLGSLVPDDGTSWDLGLRAYRAVRPFSEEEQALAHDLDVTGTVLGLANWLRWLYREQRAFDDRREAARRLGQLVERVGRWADQGG